MRNSYIAKLTKLFEANKNDQNAFWMKKYMRNQFEYYGIKTPLRKELAVAFISEAGLPKPSATSSASVMRSLSAKSCKTHLMPQRCPPPSGMHAG